MQLEPILKGVAEIAKAFGVGKETVREWVKAGMPCAKNMSRDGRRVVRIDALYQEVWEWRKRHEVRSAA